MITETVICGRSTRSKFDPLIVSCTPPLNNKQCSQNEFRSSFSYMLATHSP